jgi:hypothetical protein
MLKFSGYSYLIRGQRGIGGLFSGRGPPHDRSEAFWLLRSVWTASPPVVLGARGSRGAPTRAGLDEVLMTLEQACPPEY